MHRLGPALRRCAQAAGVDGLADWVTRPRLGDAKALGDASLDDHADCDRLAMQHAVITAQVYRVPDCVTEVERFAHSTLTLVAPNDIRLDGDAADDDTLDCRHCLASATNNRRRYRGDVLEVGRVGDDAMLESFRETGAEMLHGERTHNIRVGEARRR